MNLNPVIVLNFAFTVYGNILNLIKVVTFLDASKAFDGIDHWSPFTNNNNNNNNTLFQTIVHMDNKKINKIQC